MRRRPVTSLLKPHQSQGIHHGLGHKGSGIDVFGQLASVGCAFGAVGIAAEGTESVEGGAEMGEMIRIAEPAAGHGEGGESDRCDRGLSL